MQGLAREQVLRHVTRNTSPKPAKIDISEHSSEMNQNLVRRIVLYSVIK